MGRNANYCGAQQDERTGRLRLLHGVGESASERESRLELVRNGGDVGAPPSSPAVLVEPDQVLRDHVSEQGSDVCPNGRVPRIVVSC
jgi:hypothetical protein